MTNQDIEKQLVSVVIPAYNAEPYLKQAINSALAQSYSNLEVIVINDGSTDNTATLVSGFNDHRVRLINQSNGGMSSARNAGVCIAKGEFIAYLDADDYWMPEKLEKQLHLLNNRPDIGFCSTNTRVETPEGNFVNEWLCPDIKISTLHTIFRNSAAIAGSASSILARASVHHAAGQFDEALSGLEDTDMWMRYAAQAEYLCIPETLTVILKREHSVSRNFHNMRASALTVYKKNRPLLDNASRGRFWRDCYATIICDYAKWEARSGVKSKALLQLFTAFLYAPVSKARLCLSLSVAILLNRAF